MKSIYFGEGKVLFKEAGIPMEEASAMKEEKFMNEGVKASQDQWNV